MAPLHRALPLAAMQDRGTVCQHLDLHMAALGEIAFHVQRCIPKRCGRFTRSTDVVVGHFLGAFHHPHATPTTAGCGLEKDGIADPLGHRSGLTRIGHDLDGTWNRRYPQVLRHTACLHLSPIVAMVSGSGPTKTRPACAHRRANGAFSARKP